MLETQNMRSIIDTQHSNIQTCLLGNGNIHGPVFFVENNLKKSECLSPLCNTLKNTNNCVNTQPVSFNCRAPSFRAKNIDLNLNVSSHINNNSKQEIILNNEALSCTCKSVRNIEPLVLKKKSEVYSSKDGQRFDLVNIPMLRCGKRFSLPNYENLFGIDNKSSFSDLPHQNPNLTAGSNDMISQLVESSSHLTQCSDSDNNLTGIPCLSTLVADHLNTTSLLHHQTRHKKRRHSSSDTILLNCAVQIVPDAACDCFSKEQSSVIGPSAISFNTQTNFSGSTPACNSEIPSSISSTKPSLHDRSLMKKPKRQASNLTQRTVSPSAKHILPKCFPLSRSTSAKHCDPTKPPSLTRSHTEPVTRYRIRDPATEFLRLVYTSVCDILLHNFFQSLYWDNSRSLYSLHLHTEFDHYV